MSNKKKHKIFTENNYVPIHAIGGYLSQLKLKKKKEQENLNKNKKTK